MVRIKGMALIAFLNGPLAEGDEKVHSLKVYINGDGMHSSGTYIMIYNDDGTPSGTLKWNESKDWQ